MWSAVTFNLGNTQDCEHQWSRKVSLSVAPCVTSSCERSVQSQDCPCFSHFNMCHLQAFPRQALVPVLSPLKNCFGFEGCWILRLSLLCCTIITAIISSSLFLSLMKLSFSIRKCLLSGEFSCFCRFSEKCKITILKSHPDVEVLDSACIFISPS